MLPEQSVVEIPMSNVQYAFLRRSQVPGREALQASIDALGFDLKLDPALDLQGGSGFSPCVLAGTQGLGFELFSSPASEVLGDDAALREAIGDRDLALGMAWHGSMQDCAAALIVSCALAKDFGAAISFERDAPETFDSLMAATQEALTEVAGGDELALSTPFTNATPALLEARTCSWRKILWNDWPALAAGIAIPVVWAIHFGFSYLQSHGAGLPLWLPAGISLVMIAVLVWRIGRIAKLFAHGETASGRVLHLNIIKDRGRLTFEFDFAGKRIVTWMPIHKTQAVLSLSPGQRVEVLFDRSRPEDAIVMCLFMN